MSLNNIIIKGGTFRNHSTPTIGEFSLTAAVLSILAYDTCCDKIIVADTVTGVTVTGTTVVTDTISEKTAATGVTVDGVKLKDGGVTANSMFASFYPTALAQALSGAGAVNVTAYLTKITSTGVAQALTLANGTQIGQMKRVWHVVDGGSSVLTPVSITGGTTITFTTVNEFADLIWNGTTWNAIQLGNFTASGASPALA